MRRLRRGAREGGSIVLLCAISLFFVLSFVVAALAIGREVIAHRQLQAAADATALMAAYSLQQEGLNDLALKDPQQVVTDHASDGLGLAFHGKTFAESFLTLPIVSSPEVERHNTEYPPEQGVIPEYRTTVALTLSTDYNSKQSWFTRKLFGLKASAEAQVNEITFGRVWPAIVVVLDASETMNRGIPGSTAGAGGGLTHAFDFLRNVIVPTYIGKDYPMRSGVVVFNNAVVASTPPPKQSENNDAAITAALAKVVQPGGKTNTAAALKRAGEMLVEQEIQPGYRNVILITDGEPTKAPGAPDDTQACFDIAKTEATTLRMTVGASLFNLEIRREDSFLGAETFLKEIAGRALDADGQDPDNYWLTMNAAEVTGFMHDLLFNVCAFGPLAPQPGSGPDDFRMRGPLGDPLRGERPVNHQRLAPGADPSRRRLYVFLRDENEDEVALPLMTRETELFQARTPGFLYRAEDDFVVLSDESCQQLGRNAARRVVVRWDDAQLSKLPAP